MCVCVRAREKKCVFVDVSDYVCVCACSWGFFVTTTLVYHPAQYVDVMCP